MIVSGVLWAASRTETAYLYAVYLDVSHGSCTDHDSPRPTDQLLWPRFSNVDHVFLRHCDGHNISDTPPEKEIVPL